MVSVGCNDDFCGLQSQIDYGFVTAGTQLKIEVGGFSTNVGSGFLTISVSPPTYDLTGTLNYANGANTPMDAVAIDLKDGATVIGTTMTGYSGNYSFVAPNGSYTLAPSTTKPFIKPDGLDVILTKRWVTGLWTFTPIQLIAADVNQSGAPDGLDVIMMKRRIISLSYPAWTAADYIFYNTNVTVAGPTNYNFQSLNSGDVNGSNTPIHQVPANDDCASPTVITGPYPVTGITGTTVNATPSCPDYFPAASMPSGEVWVAIDLPYASNNVVIGYCGAALLDNGWIEGTTVQCSCDALDYLVASSFNFAAPCVTDMTWSNVPGPGTFYYPVATGTYQETWTMDVDVTEYVALPGANCALPYVIPSVPFNLTGQTTCGFGNDYTSADACLSSYMDGEDFVFEYTPAADITVSITLTNTLTWTGVFVTDGCPDVGTCVTSATASGGNPIIASVVLTGGITYYIIVDTWPTPDCTPFDIAIASTAGSYCVASTSSQDEFISNVTCGTINNTTGWQGGVADYTAQSTSIAAGGSQAITVAIGPPNYTTDQVSAWVDWNNDYTYATGGTEEFVLVYAAGSATGTISVPAGTAPGTYRMRVRCMYSTTPVPCGSSSYGEVEEYSIVVP